MELHLIDPGAVVIALQQRRIDPAIAVGHALATNSSCEPSTRYSSTLIELPGQPCAASKTCVVKRPIDSARLAAWSSQTSRLPKSVEKETAPFRSTKSCGERLIKTLFKKIVHNKNDIFRTTPAMDFHRICPSSAEY
jgi:hypothetical protein